MTEIRTQGAANAALDTNSEVQRHLAELDAKAALEDKEARPNIPTAEQRAEIAKLREELHFLRGRLTLIKEQARRAGKAHAEWLDDSAHQQLGDQPWLKLVGAMAGTFLVARMLRNVPIVTMLLPLLMQQTTRRR